MATVATTYTAGRQFKIIMEGAALIGMVSAGHGMWRMHRMELLIGSVLMCLGRGTSWGSDGAPIIVWGNEEGKAFAPDAEFSPRIGGMWASLPDPAYLEVVEGAGDLSIIATANLEDCSDGD